jgi:hypothetical protein
LLSDAAVAGLLNDRLALGDGPVIGWRHLPLSTLTSLTMASSAWAGDATARLEAVVIAATDSRVTSR